MNRRARFIWALAVIGFAAAVAIAVHPGAQAPSRPQRQRILDRLVTGPERVAPGGTALGGGPQGGWSGSAGLANVKIREPMWPGAPMHLDSQTKTWVATVILQLVADHRLGLEDTVERWVPG